MDLCRCGFEEEGRTCPSTTVLLGGRRSELSRCCFDVLLEFSRCLDLSKYYLEGEDQSCPGVASMFCWSSVDVWSCPGVASMFC